ncbi:RES domain-containing protein [Pseudescherichia vulneris]
MPFCCPNCFYDIGLKEFIIKEGENGVCSYCNSDRVHCVTPSKVKNLFEFFSYCIEQCSPGEQGHSYDEIIQDNFFLFNESVVNISVLIRDILGEEYTLEKFKLKFNPAQRTNLWDEFKDELRYQNRFFPKSSLYSSLFTSFHDKEVDGNFSELLGQLTKPVYLGKEFFRARISDTILSSVDLKMPPKGMASGGRANPIGISYLYLASNIETCISEVRPSNSSKIRISKFTLAKDVVVLDLTSPRKAISATVFEGDEVEDILNYTDLFETLSFELSKPILPDKSNIDYIPTQFLCEFIKSLGIYDGIIFNSSFGHGVNFVFFSQEYFTVHEPELYNITKTHHEFNKVT